MGYVVVGYLVTGLGLSTYAVWTLLRGRRLSQLVPPERRRWS